MSGKKLLIDNYSFISSKPVLTESENGLKEYIIEGEFGMVDKKNANNRIYPREIMEREIKLFNERLGGRGVLGELDHPEDGKTKLVRSSHVIEKLWLDENGKIMGRARVVPTSKGKDLLALYQSKAPVGISSRGYGSTMQTEEGADVVQPDFELKTFDFVEDPSAGVYPELVAESVDKNGKVVIEELSDDEQEKAKEKLGLKQEAILDDEGENLDGEDSKDDSKDGDDKSELEKNSEAEEDEAKDVKDSQADTSAEISSKMDDDSEKEEKKESVEDHLPKGYKTITGRVMSDDEVKAYNSMTDKINAYVKKGKKVPENLLNGRHHLLYQGGLKEDAVDKDDKYESAKLQLNVMLNKIEEAKKSLQNVKSEKGGDAVLEAIKQLVAPLVVENDQSEKIKELEERNAQLEEEVREFREDNEIHLGRNRKLAESLDRTVRRLYLEQTLNEIGLHNQELFFENFEYDEHETIKDFKKGLDEAKLTLKEIHGKEYMSQEDLVESTTIMVEKGKDLEEEVKQLTEEKEAVKKELLFEQRKQTVRKDLEAKGLLEGYTNKDDLIESIAKNEKGNLLEAKKIIKESGIAFKKVTDYTKENNGSMKSRLKGFNSKNLEEQLEAPREKEIVEGVNIKEFNTLAGI